MNLWYETGTQLMLLSLVLSYSERSICCTKHIFLVDLFQTNSITPREIKIKSFNAADRVITIDYMHSNPSEGKMHRLTHIPFLWDHNKNASWCKSGVWIETGQRSGAGSQSMPPGRRSCGSSSDCGYVPPTPAARRPSCGAERKWGPSRATSPESRPPYRAASRPCGAGPSRPGSSTLWLRCRGL